MKKTVIKLSKKEKVSYGLGSLGNNLIYGMMASFLLIFYTDVVGISAAAAGLLFLVARLWDGVNDPLMGHIVDNTRTKWGRFRPYLLFVPIPVLIFSFLTFTNLGLNSTGNLIFAYITYILWGMSFTAMDIPYWSMAPSLTQDQKERNSIIAIPKITALLGNFSVAIIGLPLIKLLTNGNPASGYRNTALIFGIGGIIFSWIAFFNTRERVEVKNNEKQKIKDIPKIIFNNKPLILLVISSLLGNIIINMKMQNAIYYATYYLKNENIYPIFMGIVLISTIIGMAITPIISSKLGKKKVTLYSLLFAGIFNLLVFPFDENSLTFVLIFNALATVFLGIYAVTSVSMLADCVDWGEYKTGKRSEGIIYSINSFSIKMALALSGAAIGFILEINGYVPNIIQNSDSLNAINSMNSIFPAVICLFSAFPIFFYDLTEDKYKKALEEI